MDDRLNEPLAIAAGIGALALLAWSMTNLPYDIWGAFIVAPLLLMLGVPMLRGMFRGSQSDLFGVMVVGLVAKLAGGIARYWVSFEAYGGATDAQRYHLYASGAASDVWSGAASWTSVLPRGSGTLFMERFTALVYTLTGTSRMGAFFVFSWISFWGVALFVKAAVTAIPGLARRQYALIMALAPSIVFWPSSIGKEAYMLLTLGVATFGIARLVSRSGIVVSMAITIVGLGAASFVRPHMAGVWSVGLLAGLLVMAARGRIGVQRSDGQQSNDRLAAALFIVVAVLGLSLAAKATVEKLVPGTETVSAGTLSEILTETTRRTSQDGSTFVPPSIDSPVNWPYASIRTLLRPLPTEARGLGQLLAAAELMVFFGICLVWWRRVVNVPRMVFSVPFVAFAVTTLLFAGLAYTSFANLGVLTRQKSLVFPFLLLIPCLPEGRPAALRRRQGHGNSTASIDRDQMVPAGVSIDSSPPQLPAAPTRHSGVARSNPWPAPKHTE